MLAFLTFEVLTLKLNCTTLFFIVSPEIQITCVPYKLIFSPFEKQFNSVYFAIQASKALLTRTKKYKHEQTFENQHTQAFIFLNFDVRLTLH